MTPVTYVSAARCQSLIADLHLPDPFDLDVFLATLAEQRGKPIRAVATRVGPEEPNGLLISTARADHIFYSQDAAPLQARHIVLHELGHLLLNHGADGSGPEHEVVARALTALPSKRSDDAYGRSAHCDADEVEAELFATLVGLQAAIAPAWPRRVALAIRAAHRALEPLWQLMVGLVPGVRFDVGDNAASSMMVTPDERTGYQLYRRVIEIRDAQLELCRYVPAAVRERTQVAAHAENVSEGAPAVLAEAAELAVALAAPRRVDTLATDQIRRIRPTPLSAPPTLLADAVWLLRVAAVLPRVGSGLATAN